MSQQLHDRATRGEALTAEEQTQLDAWYAQNDQAEAGELSLNSASESVATLRHQLDEALAELAQTSERVRELAAGNQKIQDENEQLRRQLSARSTTQSA